MTLRAPLFAHRPADIGRILSAHHMISSPNIFFSPYVTVCVINKLINAMCSGGGWIYFTDDRDVVRAVDASYPYVSRLKCEIKRIVRRWLRNNPLPLRHSMMVISDYIRLGYAIDMTMPHSPLSYTHS